MESPSALSSLTSEDQGGQGNQSQGQDVTSDPAHSGQLHQPASLCGRLCPSSRNKGESLTLASQPPPHPPAGWTPGLLHTLHGSACVVVPMVGRRPGIRLVLILQYAGIEDQDGNLENRETTVMHCSNNSIHACRGEDEEQTKV